MDEGAVRQTIDADQGDAEKHILSIVATYIDHVHNKREWFEQQILRSQAQKALHDIEQYAHNAIRTLPSLPPPPKPD